jgi:hypothetical protein
VGVDAPVAVIPGDYDDVAGNINFGRPDYFFDGIAPMRTAFSYGAGTTLLNEIASLN